MRRASAPSQRGDVAVKKPRIETDPLSTLLKPFNVPNRPQSNRTHLKRNATKATKTYAGLDLDPASANDSASFNDIENEIRGKRLGTRVSVSTTTTTNTAPTSILTKRFAVPLRDKTSDTALNVLNRPAPALGMLKQAKFVARPLHDPSGEFAIVLFDPTIDAHLLKREASPTLDPTSREDSPGSGSDTTLAKDVKIGDLSLDSASSSSSSSSGSTLSLSKFGPQKSLNELLGIGLKKEQDVDEKLVPIVIDPRLAKILRPHQIEGVKFLYRCTSGMIDRNAYGCIMADEMGLGKTLQCISLMWTLLRQSPTGRGGTIQKCVVVCPSSLVRNWANELDKWLGPGVLTPLAADGKSTKAHELKAALRRWATASGRQIVRPVLIISYETLRRNASDLESTEIGLLLADEGHRLKNGESLTFTALDKLNVKRRVILSGTPIQNDLSEYFALLSFANPGLLGSRQEFRKNYENAILKGRDADATDADVEKGVLKLKELGNVVNKFIIRRTNDILSKYLPVKYEHVVFCNLSPLQKSLYNSFLASPEVAKILRGTGSQPLKVIDMLKKLCNHPELLEDGNAIEEFSIDVPEEYAGALEGGGGGGGRMAKREVNCEVSGKFAVLDRMLARIRAETDDKIVLISNYTKTLDLVEKLCRRKRYASLRLDGTMAINKRQKLVDQFNDPTQDAFVFLLSSKAGGCGLNLIGANRLILMDPDWNPASDQQALARVWRDGQKKDCFVYRFISTGSIEEKIFQRQSMKQSLSSCVVDENEDVERLFSADNLRQLFKYRSDTVCDTHDTYKCKRCKNGRQFIRAQAMLYGDATTWNHFSHAELANIQDLLLRQELNHDVLSFVFQYISH